MGPRANGGAGAGVAAHRMRALAALARAALAAAQARRRAGPLRPSWSFGYEAIARFLKADAARGARLSVPDQRAARAALGAPSILRRRVRFERRDEGGVPGTWIVPRVEDARAAAAADRATVLYLHGGCYLMGSLALYEDLVCRIALAVPARVFFPEYRLAPEHPFPAAVEDAVAAYRGLLAAGTPPERLVLAGDSAGGGLAAALLPLIRDAGDALPAGALLFSPWVDLADLGGSMIENSRFDWAEPEDFASWARLYLAGADPADPRASPARASLAGLPPLRIEIGGAEMLLDQVRAFAGRARAAGARVDLVEWPDMIHGSYLMAPLFGSCRARVEGAAAWIAERAAARVR